MVVIRYTSSYAIELLVKSLTRDNIFLHKVWIISKSKKLKLAEFMSFAFFLSEKSADLETQQKGEDDPLL